MTQYKIQMQDLSGNWITMEFVASNPMIYLQQMRALARMYPERRIRVVDENDRLIDML